METTIRLSNNVKAMLDSLKVHSRESYNDVIYRTIQECKNTKVDEESLRESIEILSSPETMINIAEALRDFEKGKFVELK